MRSKHMYNVMFYPPVFNKHGSLVCCKRGKLNFGCTIYVRRRSKCISCNRVFKQKTWLFGFRTSVSKHCATMYDVQCARCTKAYTLATHINSRMLELSKALKHLWAAGDYSGILLTLGSARPCPLSGHAPSNTVRRSSWRGFAFKTFSGFTKSSAQQAK